MFSINYFGGQIKGPYSNDAEATTNGVKIGQPYYVLVSMDYGIPTGFVKIRES